MYQIFKIIRDDFGEDVVLMFDEMYLQKCEEYCGGEIIGLNEK